MMGSIKNDHSSVRTARPCLRILRLGTCWLRCANAARWPWRSASPFLCLLAMPTCIVERIERDARGWWIGCACGRAIGPEPTKAKVERRHWAHHNGLDEGEPPAIRRALRNLRAAGITYAEV